MSKISELGPIKGSNTRSEDLFVIVNLIQGDDGTKNITRKELVQALQYEIFDRITITGGSITNVSITRSQIDNNTMDNNVFNNGEIDNTDITDGTMVGTELTAVTIANSEITSSDFSDGTGNNNIFTNTIVDQSQLNNSTGNNNIFTNSTIDDSEYNNVTIDQGTANGLILTNIEIDELILEDAFISNSVIVTTDFSNGTISDSGVSNVAITDSSFANGDIRDTDLDNVTITNSRFANGLIWDTAISNSEILDTTANNIVITNSVFNDGSANNILITNSDFSDGTGNNNVFSNTVLNNAEIANASFTGTMDGVVAQNMQIGGSTSEGLIQDRSSIKNSDLDQVSISNSTIEESSLVDFDMDLKKVFEAPIDEDSYFALKNVKTGDTEKMTYRQLYDEFSRKTEKSLKVHVASDGDDRNPGTILKPVRTLKRAEELALEKAGGSYNRNDINNAVHISVGPGTYYVDEPIALPDDCSMTSTAGQYATVIQKKPGWERTNGILVGSGCYVQGFSYMNFEVDNFDQPEGGFAIAYRPGALLRRSPYLRDSSQLSNFNRLDVEPPLNPFNSKGTILDLGQEFYLEVGHSPQAQFEVDDEVTFSSGASGYISYVDDIDSNRQIYVRNLKGNVEVGDMLYAQRGGTGTVQSIGIDDFPNRLVGRGGGCLLADRAVLDTDSLYTYVLCFGFTPRTQNGTGYVAKNGAGVNGIGSLSIFTRQAFFALDGGQMTLNNSGSQFGDISMRARGNTVIIKPAEANETNIIANTAFADVLEDSKEEIIDSMIEHLTSNTTSGGLGYQGYNADKCFRDTGIIVDNTGYDVATNSNYWGRLNGITYRSPISYVVVNEQLNETVGSIEHLKDSMDHIFENTTQDVKDRVNVSLSETLNVLQNGEEFANDIIFSDTGNGSAVAARELVQDNREFIIEEFIDWLDNNEEFYAYDSTKCKRDVRDFILPAVKYDSLLETNYNSVTAGNAYYFKAAKNVIGAQRDETIAAYERLRQSTDALIENQSSALAVDAYEKFNEIINILKMEGDKFTPSAATYDPATGNFVITINNHGLEVGRYVLLSAEAFTFTCDTDGNKLEFKHPRKTDPAFKSALPITAATDSTITVNVGSTGYKGVHTLKAVANDAVIVLGSAIKFSDNGAIPANNRNARKQLQSNKAFIQDYMMDWADNEWFFYDSKKCSRDMKDYIVPAVLRDMQTGTNFNSIQSGIAYRQGIAKVAVSDQLTETIGAIDFLRQETANTVTDPVAIQRVDDGYNEIINIARNNSKKYTPTNATYDVVTGIMEVTIGSHDFQIGDTIIIEKESMTFECGTPAVQISHPRETDPAFNTPLTITAKTATTITVNVGNAGGYTGAHTFVSATANAIREADIYNGKFTPSAVDYNPINGDMTINIGQHNLPVGKWISIADESITLSCPTSDVDPTPINISHPRATDPAFRQPVRITAVTADTITVNVANANGYDGVHTFVSADVDCIDTNAIYWTDPAKIDSFHTPSTATYDPATGDMVITLGTDHGFTTDDHVEFKPQSMVFSCVNTATTDTVEISHPRIGEPNYQMPLEITATDATTITINVGDAGGYAGAHTFVSAEEGSLVKTPAGVTRQGRFAANKLQENRTFLQDEVDAWIRSNYFVYNDALCARDTGLILDAVRRDMATGSNVNSVFAGLAYRSGNASTESVIANELTETVGAITWLKGEVQGITSGTGTTRADAAFDEIIDIMQNGVAAADPVSFGSSYVSSHALQARQALQANKAFLQDEVTAWIAANYPTFTYNVADCERDLGYFIDAISWDVQHGSNAATLKNARLYFDKAVGVLAEDEKPVTAAAYKHIAELAGQIVREEEIQNPSQSVSAQTLNAASNGLTPTDAAYDPVTGVMVVTVSSHNLNVGDYVVIAENGITLECGSPAQQISHPRATDPYFNTPIRIDAVTPTTFTMQVGNAGGYAEAHTFVSALANAIRPSVAPQVAKEAFGLFDAIGNIVLEDNFTETFTNAGVGTGIPQIKEPALSGTGYDPAINVMHETIAGSTAKYQREIIDFIREEYNGLGFDTDLCYRDTGLIIDAITEDMEYGGDAATANAAQYYFKNAINILPYEQREPTRMAFEHLASVSKDVVQGIAVTPTAGNVTAQITSGNVADITTATRTESLINVVSATVDNRLVIPDYAGSLDITQQTPEDLPTANEITKPAIEPSRTFARKSLQMNKDFIQDEVVAFINDKYFVYNEGKCERDVGYILDAVKRDIQTGSDYPSKYAGRAYRAGNAGTDVVINEQLAETIEGIKYLRKDIEPRLSGVALTRATAAFDNIITIMKNNVVVTYSSFGTANVGNSDNAATDGLQLNRAFLAAEGKAHFQQTYPTLWAALTPAQRDKCERDIGFLVDAASFDIRHGSNVAMRDVARLYFENGNSILPADQRAETAGVFSHVAGIAERVVLKQTVTPTPGNAVSQVLTGFGNVVAGTGQDVQDLINIVTTIIEENSLINMPAAQEPNTLDPAATGYDYEVQVAIVEGRKADLAAGINKYLQDKFDYLEYNSVKCRRDVGYMVDAISHDIQYGGNAAMWNSAQIYFVNMTNLLPLDQRDATREAFTRMAEVVHHVIRNEAVVKSPGNTSVQDMSNLTARRVIAQEAKELGMMVAHIADDNNPDNLPSRIEPNTDWMSEIVKTQKDLVDNSLESLVTSMINFISTEYKGISYPKEKCRRDVGIIVDALSHDVQYQTNYATRLCANMYFDNATSVLPFDQRTQTADFYVTMADVVDKVVQELQVGQDTSGTPATSVEGEWVADMVRIIEESIRRDSLDALPALIEPDTSWVDVDKVAAAEEIDLNLNELADDVTDFIADNFTIVDYSKAKCRRDSGYILDAMSWDLNYGGNLASRWNADFYFWNNELRIPENTRVATAQSYRKLGEIVSKVVVGQYPGQAMRPETGSEEQSTQAYDLGLIFYNALFYNSPKALGPTIKPNFEWEDTPKFRFAKDILDNNRTKLQREVQRFITSEYKFIDLPKTYRDAGNLIKILANDFRFIDPALGTEGSDKASRAFVGALFNIDAQHVFPVFNPPATFADWRKLRFKGTVANTTERDALTGMKRWDCYIIPTDNNANRYVGEIFYWTGVTWATAGQNNTDLLESFVGAWEHMRDYINNNVAVTIPQRTMITELIDNVLIDSVIRPNFLVFGSLVESIAHQFNGASAGVNRNALPLNFRNVGAAIGANASVLSENGGRIRWSGSDELNNQYFARGLRINGRTGRIEGRPFTSSVRKLARRASNSRASL